jgi:sucrose-6-phosphate hydrolase SacC (GH32 family)
MRPEFHFTPATNWMNDPNGLLYYKGLFHIFYQYNPEGDQWGHMSWGHATSSDLLTWTELPVAIRDDERAMIFSGSAVVDHQNSSGFGSIENPPMVAIYTEHQEEHQAQGLAYSLDEGITWTKYANNPVLDLNKKDFRDPKVTWDSARQHWLMAVALPQEFIIQFYKSDDLKSWTHLSNFGPVGAVGGIWECPDLFELEVDGTTKWVLIVSLNPGGPVGGSATQYFIGDFDGMTFAQTEYLDEIKWIDFGADYYAAVSFNDAPDNRRIMIGWMSNWDYAKFIDANPYRGQMSLPREISLEKIDGQIELIQKPVREASHLLRNIEITNDPIVIAGGIKIGFDPATQSVYVDRSMSSINSAVHSVPVKASNGVAPAQLVVDRGSLELFIDGGRQVITDLFLL